LDRAAQLAPVTRGFLRGLTGCCEFIPARDRRSARVVINITPEPPCTGFAGTAARSNHMRTPKIRTADMKLSKVNFLVSALIAGGASGVGAAEASRSDAVFAMTNDATQNEVIAYERTAEGSLQSPRHYSTDGRGSGGVIDPLSSQSSLRLSQDGNWLFAVNAGSGTLSVFRVEGSQLFLTDRIATEGSEPTSVTQQGSLVYVLNAAGSSSVVGFYFGAGKLVRIPDSLKFLSENLANPGSVALSPNGHFLVVTEKATNSIDVFPVLANGTLGTIVTDKTVGPGTFSAAFAPGGVALVAETGPAGATNGSSISSYAVQANGTLTAVSSSIPTLGAATCWVEVTPNGHFAYTSNAGTASVSGFAIAANGALTAIPGTVVGSNATGSTNLDIAVSSDGKFVYTLNAGKGTIGAFAIEPATGQLTNLGIVSGGLAAGGSLNGLAAN
jgi:6-phosphogluconolactonase